MKDNYKYFILALLTAFSIFMVGCKQKEKEEAKTENSSLTTTINSIEKSTNVTIIDNSAAAIIWIPKKPNDILDKVAIWLKNSSVYTEKIPNSQNSRLSNANIGPSVLSISTTQQSKISIKPAFYITLDNGGSYKLNYIDDILELDIDMQNSYIKSKPLYKWLKSDEWETEFKRK